MSEVSSILDELLSRNTVYKTLKCDITFLSPVYNEYGYGSIWLSVDWTWIDVLWIPY